MEIYFKLIIIDKLNVYYNVIKGIFNIIINVIFVMQIVIYVKIWYVLVVKIIISYIKPNVKLIYNNLLFKNKHK